MPLISGVETVGAASATAAVAALVVVVVTPSSLVAVAVTLIWLPSSPSWTR
jgi:hypothetical protein